MLDNSRSRSRHQHSSRAAIRHVEETVIPIFVLARCCSQKNGNLRAAVVGRCMHSHNYQATDHPLFHKSSRVQTLKDSAPKWTSPRSNMSETEAPEAYRPNRQHKRDAGVDVLCHRKRGVPSRARAVNLRRGQVSRACACGGSIRTGTERHVPTVLLLGDKFLQAVLYCDLVRLCR